MSDLCMYEIEDIVWNHFGESDDHIVPRPGDKQQKGYAFPSSSYKKRWREVTCAGNNTDGKGAVRNVTGRKEKTGCRTLELKKERMMEKGAWSQSNGAFHTSFEGNSSKSEAITASDHNQSSNHCIESANMDSLGSELCADNPVLGGQCAAVDNNLYCYPLSDAAQTENDLGFLENDHQEKESDDLLYYSWPEIENFEDVDRMFRSCDSTFGLGIDNEEDLAWFSSSQAAEGSDDALRSSSKFSAFDTVALNAEAEQGGASGLDNNDLFNESNYKLTSTSWKTSPEKLDGRGAAPIMHSAFPNGLGAVPLIDNGSQLHSCVNQSKHQKRSNSERKEQYLANGSSIIQFENLEQAGQLNDSFVNSNFQRSSSSGSDQQKQNIQDDCLQQKIPLTHSRYGNPSNQVLSSSAPSAIKSEDNGLTSMSPRESSYASTQMQSLESPHSFQASAVTTQNMKEKLHHQHGSLAQPERSSLMTRAPVQKQVPNFEREIECHSEINGSSTVIPAEIDSSNVQESSCVSSALDEVSIEASGYRQLRHVMEQLDVRTKLCIRDSLYRLARSAEQRHKCRNLAFGQADNKDASGALTSDEANKCGGGFMDMETDTNPIDRSIAHLLFHRPSDLSLTTPFDALPVSSNTMVQTSSSNGSMMAERLVYPAESAIAANNKTVQL